MKTGKIVGATAHGSSTGADEKPPVIINILLDVVRTHMQVVSFQHLWRQDMNEVNTLGLNGSIIYAEPFHSVIELTADSSVVSANVAICMVDVLCWLTPTHTLPLTWFLFSHSVT